MDSPPAPRDKISLDSIPNEIVSHLLYFLSPEDNLLCFQLLCKHLNRLANSRLLWRQHCERAFKYWNPDHEFQRKLQLPVGDVDWKRLFLVRKERNTRIAQLFDGILARRAHRLHRFEQLCLLGYDAKDFLLEQCATEDDAQDALARRYYGRHVLDSIHRSLAIEEWQSLMAQGETENREDTGHSNIVIERCLAAFGMFVLHNQYGDIDEVSLMLDNLATQFEASEPGLERMTIREKALCLNVWLRANNLTGIANPRRDYRRMRNCFIGQALLHPPHESLPIISSAIFCSLATRIGLRAQSCLFPGHVHVAVFPEARETLDSNNAVLSDEGDSPDIIYLDPYGSDREVSEDILRGLVSSFGWRYNSTLFHAPTQPWSLMMRMGHNVIAMLQNEPYGSVQDEPHVSPLDTTQPVSGSSVVNREAVKQSFRWLRMILHRPGTQEWNEAASSLILHILDADDSNWRIDFWLLRKYLYPLRPNLDYLDIVRRRIDGFLEWDTKEPSVHRERNGTTKDVYRVGQVVYNKRLSYVGIVTKRRRAAGRDATGHTYNLLRASSFEVLLSVPQDSLVSVNDRAQIPQELFELAGLYFDRFDQKNPETCQFIPSEPLRLQYPDG